MLSFQDVRAAIPALAIMLACSSGSKSNGSAGGPKSDTPATPAKPSLTLFFSSELKGQIEPCGCTSDPLGDLARTSQLINAAKSQGPVIVLDGGSTLYSQLKLSDATRAQEQLKSELVFNTLKDSLAVSAFGLGPFDLSEGAAKVRPPRQAANLSAESGVPIEAPKIVEAGGIKVGVFGVVSPAALSGLVEVSDPAAAASAAIAKLKEEGAQVIIAMAHMTKDEARALAKAAPGADFMLIGQNLPEPDKVRAEPMKVGETWLFRPANRGQVLSRIELTYRGAGSYADAIGSVRAQTEIERLNEQLATLKLDLEKWQSDPNADKAFIAGKEKELEELAARKAGLEKSPLQAPAEGNYFTLAQLKINKQLDCQAEIVAAKRNYDKAAGQANLKALADKKPTPAPKGAASYVGMEECEMCHSDAVEFWKGTQHAGAWETLVDGGKELNLDCIGCHVTGFDKPGGSTLAFNEALRDVQCEQCHGPGSLHVEAEGADEKKASISRDPSEAVCLGCHTPDHSDTFEFSAYLRDVTGPGHGEERRSALGEGATGHELRSAALTKAGASIGANCPK